MCAKQTIEYGLSNFKAFGQGIQRMSLKPITLLYGPNSSGKSSIIHSLLYLHELARGSNKKDVYRTTLGEEFVDLGGFENYAYGKSDNKNTTLEFSHTFEHAVEGIEEFSNWEVIHCIQFDSGQIKLTNIEYRINGEKAYDLKPNPKNPIEFKISLNGESEWFDYVFSNKKTKHKYADEILNFSKQFFLEKFEGDFFGLIVSSDKPEELDNYRKFLDILPKEDMGAFTDPLVYLAGLRNIPEKAFFDGGAPPQQNLNAGGMAYWEEIRSNAETREKVNQWLKLLFEHKKYNIDVISYLSPKEASDIALHFFEDLKDSEGLEELGKFDPIDEAFKFREALNTKTSKMQAMRIMQDKLELTAKELGVGVSQVIPLLGAACSKDKLIMVEQPEIHLHPKQQADLGEVFAESAFKNNNRFVIETHSIQLLERLGKIIREVSNGDLHRDIPLKVEDIAVYYVKPDDSGVTLLEIELDNNGKTKFGWPDGFFNEDLGDLF